MFIIYLYKQYNKVLFAGEMKPVTGVTTINTKGNLVFQS